MAIRLFGCLMPAHLLKCLIVVTESTLAADSCKDGGTVAACAHGSLSRQTVLPHIEAICFREVARKV